MKYILYPLYTIHSIFFWIWFALMSIFFSVTGQIAGFILGPFFDKGRIMHPFARGWAITSLWGGLIRVQVENLEKADLEKGEVRLYLANHQGFFDILVLTAYLPRIAFMAKESLFKTPFIGKYMKALGFIPVNRTSIKGAAKAIREASDRLKSGVSVLMFPEGTRSETGEVSKFRRGPTQAAVMAEVKVQPCAISGSFEVLKKGSFVLKGKKIRLFIGEAKALPEKLGREEEEELCQSLRGEILALMGMPEN